MGKKMKRKITLSSLLTGLVALSVSFTLIIVLLISYHLEKQALINTSLSLNYSNAQDLSHTVDTVFKTMRESLQSTTTFLSHHNEWSEQEIQEYLQLVRHVGGYFNSIIWVDEMGVLREVSPPLAAIIGQKLNSAASKEALKSKKPLLSAPYIGTTGRLIVLMSEPFFDKYGNYKGFIGGTMYLEENNVLSSILGSSKVDETGSYFYVVGPSGNLLYHPDAKRLGEDTSRNKIIQKLMVGKSGKEQVINTLGITFLAGYVAIPESGWGVVVQTPINTIYDQLFRNTKRLVVFMLLPFFLLLLVAIWLARKLANPFVSLANLVSQMTEGENVTIPKMKQHWNREVFLLTNTVIFALSSAQEQNERLSQAAMTDPLTGLTNRRSIDAIMSKWHSEGVKYTILLMDIDRFKLVNDRYGHPVGDEVIKHVTQMMISSVRPGDVCGRYGGEEFVVLLPETTASDSFIAAERIRTNMEKTNSPTGNPITVSLGLAEYFTPTNTPENLLQLADKALYKAKSEGRNKTVIANQINNEKT
ncbi:sensor domain-containing diguanylate cyclase [Paenibacillus sp. SYP-B3998]|nr:sensor domain-containing diguanylate cyclase [Paenibacillus sp. SYP-B3998]